jgi:hypothetical protein
LAPGQMHLGKTRRVSFDAEQHFVASTATGDGSGLDAEQWMTLAHLDVQLCLQSPGRGSGGRKPWFRQRLRFAVEEKVVAGIDACVRPGPMCPGISHCQAPA